MDTNPATSMQTNKSINRKRFSNQQVKSMESMFNSESRPGSKTKQQIADELGLHPRQVSVWFQNKRARSKSKQTERDYSILKACYDSLASKYEALEKENQHLINEVQRLRGFTERPKGSTSDTTPATCSSNGESISLSSPEKHIAQPEDYVQDKIMCEAVFEGFTNTEEETDNHENIDMTEMGDGSILEPTYLIEHNSGLDWWEFWT
ncbi:homeobox-leucine zipper protein ATHB-12-like [Amaranthus tricolor]|uniref:homeobox-leucine zipper protein ATHB-12-like n=1 Tax=Amaranthus tricolor TaxID=29722 RepID=UPI00258CCC02|nr:homeobox-leucine zipper protein ATHB-12-like [Amaranthus tricolor]